MSKATVINLAAGPGAGKSTTAAGLFYNMKLAGHKVELVTEFAKDRTYSESARDLHAQLFILGEQDRRMRCLEDQVDWIITDSPLFISAVYGTGPYGLEWFKDAAHQVYHTYNNKLFFIQRVKPYKAYGRSQTELEALQLDADIWLEAKYCQPVPIVGDETAPNIIIEYLGL